MSRSKWWMPLGAIAITAIALSGCAGPGGDPTPSTSGTPTGLTPEGKLKERAEVTINVANRAVLDFSGPLLADELGIFDDYGIDLKVESVPTNEAIPLLATGRLDVLIGGLNAGLFNAISGGSDLRVVAPGNYQAPDSNIGFWASSAWLDGRDFSPELLKGSKHGSSQGVQGITMVNYVRLLEKGGLTVDDVEIVTMPQTDQVIALENGSLSTGTPSPAGATTFEENGSAQFVAPQIPEGWPVVVLMFGPTLLDERPEVGMAFTAAMRTLYRDYLQGDYMDDPKVVDALVAVTEQTPEALESVVPFVYEPELSIPDDYISEMDKTWRLFPDVLQSPEPFTFEDVVDTRFMEFANGL